MLHVESVEPSTLELLKRIQALPALAETRLVGGTALALQLGHRVSVGAEEQPLPRMLVPFDWEAAKDEIRAAVRSLFGGM